MAEISLRAVTKTFGAVKVFRDLHLTVKDGEFFTFVGPSGCGKSTILNMIAGLESVTSGTICFDGKEVTHLSPKERDVSMVFQSYALYPHMTVYHNIAFPLKMRKIRKTAVDSQVRKVASMLGLEGLLNRKPRELSGGQRQRVALGRAIIRHPKVFLMDEPLSNLDARLRVDMRSELKKLHNALQITTVYVTHDQAEAMSLSDRIAVLHDGEIQQCGTPHEIYLRPDNAVVAGFIGSPSMNFLKASVHRREASEVICNGTVFVVAQAVIPAQGSLLLGIRPEDITVTGSNAGNGIEVTVTLIESAGSFHWVDILWKNEKLKGISSLDEILKTGSRAFMSVPAHKIIVFDAHTAKRL